MMLAPIAPGGAPVADGLAAAASIEPAQQQAAQQQQAEADRKARKAEVETWWSRIGAAEKCTKREARLKVAQLCQQALDGKLTVTAKTGIVAETGEAIMGTVQRDSLRNFVQAQFETLLPAVIAQQPQMQVQLADDMSAKALPDELRELLAQSNPDIVNEQEVQPLWQESFVRVAEKVLNVELSKAGLKLAAEEGVAQSMIAGGGWLKLVVYPGERAKMLRDRGDLQTQLDKVGTNLSRLAAHADQYAGMAGAPDCCDDQGMPMTEAQQQQLRRDTEAQIEALSGQIDQAVRPSLVVESRLFGDIIVPKGTVSLRQLELLPWIAEYCELPVADYERAFGPVPANVQCSGDGADRLVPMYEVADRLNSRTFWLAKGAEDYSGEPQPVQRQGGRFFPWFLVPWRWVPMVKTAADKVDPFPRGAVEDWLREQHQIDHKARRQGEYLDGHRAAMIVNSASLKAKDVTRIDIGDNMELIAVDMTDAGQGAQAFAQYPNPAYNEQLYDPTDNLRVLDQLSGVPDFQRSGPVKTKTLGEAELSAQAAGGRQASRLAALEAVLGELGLMALEQIYTHYSLEDVVHAVGSAAQYVWPVNKGLDWLRKTINVQVMAGSSGKPDRNAELRRLTELLPILKDMLAVANSYVMQGNFVMAQAIRNLFGDVLYRADERLSLEAIWPEKSVQAPVVATPTVRGAPPGAGAAPTAALVPPQAAAAMNTGPTQPPALQ